MERSAEEAIAREEKYSRIGKARRAAGAIKRGEFPVPGCPIPRSELAILALRDQGLPFKEIAKRHGCTLIGVKKLTQNSHARISLLTEEDIHSTDSVLQYVKEQGWLDKYRGSQSEKVA